MYKLVIFDLDGTLLDTSEGIYNSVRYAEARMCLKPIGEEKLKLFVGPPPSEMYQKLYQLSEAEALNAVIFHREYGRNKAIYEAEIYPGIIQLFEEMKRKDIKIAVATLKVQDIAEKILGIFGLEKYCDVIVGMDKGESLTKGKIIQQAMQKVFVQPWETVMVGDSLYDEEGAREAGVDFIGVLYGYGFGKEDKKQRDRIQAENVYELGKLINIY